MLNDVFIALCLQHSTNLFSFFWHRTPVNVLDLMGVQRRSLPFEHPLGDFCAQQRLASLWITPVPPSCEQTSVPELPDPFNSTYWSLANYWMSARTRHSSTEHGGENHYLTICLKCSWAGQEMHYSLSLDKLLSCAACPLHHHFGTERDRLMSSCFSVACLPPRFISQSY